RLALPRWLALLSAAPTPCARGRCAPQLKRDSLGGSHFGRRAETNTSRVNTRLYRTSVPLIVAVGAALACSADRQVTRGSGEDTLVYKFVARKLRVEPVRQTEILAHDAH